MHAHMKKKVSDPGHPEPGLKSTQLTGELPTDCAGQWLSPIQAAFVGFFSSAEGGTAQLGRPGRNHLEDLVQITHHPRLSSVGTISVLFHGFQRLGWPRKKRQNKYICSNLMTCPRPSVSQMLCHSSSQFNRRVITPHPLTLSPSVLTEH